MTNKRKARHALNVIGAIVLGSAIFLSGFLFAVERMVSLPGLLSRPIMSWFRPQTAILFDDELIAPSDTAAFNRVMGLLKSRFYREVDTNLIMESAIKGLASGSGDPYTTYFSPEEMKSFLESATGNYVGIGVSVSMDEDGLLTVAELFPDSPALAAGIHVGDKIVRVDDEDVTEIKDSGLIIRRIKGEEGTAVKVTVYRPNTSDYLDFEMIRAAINVPNISARMLDENIGYIRIGHFDDDIARDFVQEWQKLAEAGATALVLDLRYNPGGDFGQVVSISDMLVPEGLIVYTKDRDGVREEQHSDMSALGIPMSVLVNEFSASASEILSAALQDHEMAVIVGEKTFGKGMVQTIDTAFANGAGFRYTISTYFSPDGNNIQNEGVTPDVVIALDEEFASLPLTEIPEGKDNQLNAGIEEIRNIRGSN